MTIKLDRTKSLSDSLSITQIKQIIECDWFAIGDDLVSQLETLKTSPLCKMVLGEYSFILHRMCNVCETMWNDLINTNNKKLFSIISDSDYHTCMMTIYYIEAVRYQKDIKYRPTNSWWNIFDRYERDKEKETKTKNYDK